MIKFFMSVLLSFCLQSGVAHAASDTLLCYFATGSNSYPSCDAPPKALTLGGDSTFSGPDLNITINRSTAAGVYTVSVGSTNEKGAPLSHFGVILADPRFSVHTASNSPDHAMALEPLDGGGFRLTMTDDMFRPINLKSFVGNVLAIESESGSQEVYLQIGMVKSMICRSGDSFLESRWPEFVAHYFENCVK